MHQVRDKRSGALVFHQSDGDEKENKVRRRMKELEKKVIHQESVIAEILERLINITKGK